ncbi:hypothetical protein LJR230_004333 [Trinickia sp. LjRoot230]|uniref:hypothetical protein n=1 Tax=Trinickia sp. LjRoot230 TaxID=3342288 RepID=UPI003ECF66E7
MDAQISGVQLPLPAALAPKPSQIPASLTGLSRKPAPQSAATFVLPRAYAIKVNDEVPVAIEPPKLEAVRSRSDLLGYLAIADLSAARDGVTTGNALLAERTRQMREAVQDLVDSGDFENYIGDAGLLRFAAELNERVELTNLEHFYHALDPALRQTLGWTSIDQPAAMWSVGQVMIRNIQAAARPS